MQDAGGELLAGLPVVEARSPRGGRRWVSLPFTDSCAPLIRADVARDEVLAAVDAHVLATPVRGLEVRAALPAGGSRHPEPAGYIHTLALPSDPAHLHPNKGHRNYRNKAVRNGVVVTQGRTRAGASRRSTGCTRSPGAGTACRCSREGSSTCCWSA